MHTNATGIRGIVQATVPVSDLARSAVFYRDLLGLRYVREFGDGKTVTGCALADFEARYLISLRRRDTLAGGEADLRGEHPVIVEAESSEAAERIRERATGLGIGSTSGTHADGTWIEFLDPDGIAVRVVHSAKATESFFGVVLSENGEPEFYDSLGSTSLQPLLRCWYLARSFLCPLSTAAGWLFSWKGSVPLSPRSIRSRRRSSGMPRICSGGYR